MFEKEILEKHDECISIKNKEIIVVNIEAEEVKIEEKFK